MHEIQPDIAWIALAVSILTNKNPDRAIDSLVTDPNSYDHTQDSTDLDAELTRLKKAGYTYKEIGLMFNMSWDAVRQRINRYKRRTYHGN